MIRLGRSLIPGQSVAKSSVERRLSYQPALDGMRALAVAAVLAYHAGLPWARGGFLGVDAFFVLSGFLITSLLLAEWRSQGGINLPGVLGATGQTAPAGAVSDVAGGWGLRPRLC